MRVSCGLSAGRVTSQSQKEQGALTKPGLAGQGAQAVVRSQREGAAWGGPPGRSGWEEEGAVLEVDAHGVGGGGGRGGLFRHRLTGRGRGTSWDPPMQRDSSAGEQTVKSELGR